jgi:type I restriction enzyme M protein
MWFQTLWYHLNEKGTAGVVMANGAMTTGSAGEKNVREYMIENCMVDCIVQMPDKLFLTTGIPACLFILSKNRDGKDGLHRERENEILFIDARKLGKMVSRRLRVFEEEDLKKIADAYHNWRNTPQPPSRGEEGNSSQERAQLNSLLKDGRGEDTQFPPKVGQLNSPLKGGQGGVKNYEDIPGFCKTATLDEVKANTYVLSPGRYVGTEAEEDDGIPFEEKMEKLTEELMEQFEEGRKLELQIKASLKCIDF